MFRSITQAIAAIFNTITTVGDTAGKAISMATTYVDNRATAQNLTDKQQVMLDTAKTMQVLQDELKSDEALKAIYDSLQEEFN